MWPGLSARVGITARTHYLVVKGIVGKLVRDRIPEIIRHSGRVPIVKTLARDAYRTALIDKLYEEVGELTAAESANAVIEEAADIFEVLSAVAAEHGARINDVIEVACRKRSARGGFELRVWLEDVANAYHLTVGLYTHDRYSHCARPTVTHGVMSGGVVHPLR